MNVLIIGTMQNLQSGVYFKLSFEELGHTVRVIDPRVIIGELGISPAQSVIIQKVKEIDIKPDLILILKGLELTLTTLKEIRKTFEKATLINWYPDIILYERPIWEKEEYYENIKLYDYFFCTLRGVATELKEKGFDNVYYLGGACYPKFHGEQYMNSFQKQKYNNDVVFCGTLGFFHIHFDRIKYLQKIIEEGFDIKIWGKIICDLKKIPPDVRHHCTGEEAINEKGAMVYQSSEISLGIDGMPELDSSWSVRLYRIMCAGGLLLNTNTTGLKEFFKINETEDAPITPDQDLVVFYDENDLIKKLDFLLSHKEICDSIRKNGQKKVIEKYKFTDMIEELMEVIKDE